MARNGSGVYQKPVGTTPADGDDIDSAPFNLLMDDIAADLNLVRPIVAGGTGASTAVAAIAALGGLAGANNLSDVVSKPKALAALRSYTTTATAGGTTTLTNTSSVFQVFTGAMVETIVLPVATTLASGWVFEITNNSTGALTIQSSGANVVGSIPPGISARVICILASGTTAASWDFDYSGFSAISGTGATVLQTGATLNAPVFSKQSLTAGTNAQGQGAITGDLVVVGTTAANPSGVTLPVAVTGRRIVVVNNGTNPINIYPASGAAIGALAVNVAIPLAAGGQIIINASTATQWFSTAIATQAEAEAGTNNTSGMTPLRTSQAIAAQSLLTKKYEPAPVSITIGGSYTFTHGLGVVPVLRLYSLVCISAERGWEIDDEIDFCSGTENYNSNVAPAIAVNDTTIKVRFGDDQIFRTIGMNGSSRSFLSSTKWKLKVRAYA